MNESWKKALKKYIACYEAIQLLEHEDIFDEEEKSVHEHNLLFNIVEAFRSEVEE